MNNRIEKKLSKRIKELLPNIYHNDWKCEETKEWCVGGGLDYWGEGQDDFTVWEDFSLNFNWILDFDAYPDGHRLEGYPNVEGFKPTAINLLRKAKEHQCQAK